MAGRLSRVRKTRGSRGVCTRDTWGRCESAPVFGAGPTQRKCPPSRGKNHAEAERDGERTRRHSEIQHEPSHIAAAGYRTHAEAVIGAEDSAAEAVFGVN